MNAAYDEIGNTRKRESVKKPYEIEKDTNQNRGKGYKISSSSSISISLHSGTVSTIPCSKISLSNGFKSGSRTVPGLVCLVFILFVIAGKSILKRRSFEGATSGLRAVAWTPLL